MPLTISFPAKYHVGMDESSNPTPRPRGKPTFPMWGPACLLSGFFGGLVFGIVAQVVSWTKHGMPDVFLVVIQLLISMIACSIAGFTVSLFILAPRVAKLVPLGPACLLFGFLGGVAFSIGETLVTWVRYGMKIHWPDELIASVLFCSFFGTVTGFFIWLILSIIRIVRQGPVGGGQ